LHTPEFSLLRATRGAACAKIAPLFDIVKLAADVANPSQRYFAQN
jgi:hypothetical protein